MAANLIIEEARLMFCNFKGKGSQYNREGNKTFCVEINNEEDALAMREEGWNVKELRRDDPDEKPTYYISVNASYGNYPPTVILVTRDDKGKILSKRSLDERTVEMLDGLRIMYADITIAPYHWTKGRDSGIKGYLRKMYVNIQQESYEDKYMTDDDYDSNSGDRAPWPSDDDCPFE